MDALIYIGLFFAFWFSMAMVFKKLGFMKEDEEALRNDRNKNKLK